MLTTLEGVYRDGVIELNDLPAGVREARVLVTFVETITTTSDGGKPRPQLLTFGKYSTGRKSTEEDFRAAEWAAPSL